MLEKIKTKIKKNTEIIALGLLIIVTITSTTFYNHNKNKILDNYKNTINNVFLKKTIKYLFDNLEPKFRKIDHKVQKGETFDNILKQYDISESEISEIKEKISKKIDLNKLNTKNNISFVFDQTNNFIKEFTFKISNKEKIFLKKDVANNEFNQKIVVTKLKKNVLYKENIILQSLYKSASEQKIPANIIIEFARIYGFQIDFQRDIRKLDGFQNMYKFFKDDNGKKIETGNILLSKLKVSGVNKSIYY